MSLDGLFPCGNTGLLWSRFESLVGQQVFRLRVEGEAANIPTSLHSILSCNLSSSERMSNLESTRQLQRNTNALDIDKQPLCGLPFIAQSAVPLLHLILLTIRELRCLGRNMESSDVLERLKNIKQSVLDVHKKALHLESQLHQYVNPTLVTTLNRRTAKATFESDLMCKLVDKLRKNSRNSATEPEKRKRACELTKKLKTLLLRQKCEWQCVGRLKETIAMACDMKLVLKFICQLCCLLEQCTDTTRRLTEQPPPYEYCSSHGSTSKQESSDALYESMKPSDNQPYQSPSLQSEVTISLSLDFLSDREGDNGSDHYNNTGRHLNRSKGNKESMSDSDALTVCSKIGKKAKEECQRVLKKTERGQSRRTRSASSCSSVRSDRQRSDRHGRNGKPGQNKSFQSSSAHSNMSELISNSKTNSPHGSRPMSTMKSSGKPLKKNPVLAKEAIEEIIEVLEDYVNHVSICGGKNGTFGLEQKHRSTSSPVYSSQHDNHAYLKGQSAASPRSYSSAPRSPPTRIDHQCEEFIENAHKILQYSINSKNKFNSQSLLKSDKEGIGDYNLPKYNESICDESQLLEICESLLKNQKNEDATNRKSYIERYSENSFKKREKNLLDSRMSKFGADDANFSETRMTKQDLDEVNKIRKSGRESKFSQLYSEVRSSEIGTSEYDCKKINGSQRKLDCTKLRKRELDNNKFSINDFNEGRSTRTSKQDTYEIGISKDYSRVSEIGKRSTDSYRMSKQELDSTGRSSRGQTEVRSISRDERENWSERPSRKEFSGIESNKSDVSETRAGSKDLVQDRIGSRVLSMTPIESRSHSERVSNIDLGEMRSGSRDQSETRTSTRDNSESRISNQDVDETGMSSRDDIEPRMSTRDDIEVRMSTRDDNEAGMSTREDMEAKMSTKDDIEARMSTRDDVEARMSARDDVEARISAKDYPESRMSTKYGIESRMRFEDLSEKRMGMNDLGESKNSSKEPSNMKMGSKDLDEIRNGINADDKMKQASGMSKNELSERRLSWQGFNEAKLSYQNKLREVKMSNQQFGSARSINRDLSRVCTTNDAIESAGLNRMHYNDNDLTEICKNYLYGYKASQMSQNKKSLLISRCTNPSVGHVKDSCSCVHKQCLEKIKQSVNNLNQTRASLNNPGQMKMSVNNQNRASVNTVQDLRNGSEHKRHLIDTCDEFIRNRLSGSSSFVHNRCPTVSTNICRPTSPPRAQRNESDQIFSSYSNRNSTLKSERYTSDAVIISDKLKKIKSKADEVKKSRVSSHTYSEQVTDEYTNDLSSNKNFPKDKESRNLLPKQLEMPGTTIKCFNRRPSSASAGKLNHKRSIHRRSKSKDSCSSREPLLCSSEENYSSDDCSVFTYNLTKLKKSTELKDQRPLDSYLNDTDSDLLEDTTTTTNSCTVDDAVRTPCTPSTLQRNGYKDDTEDFNQEIDLEYGNELALSRSDSDVNSLETEAYPTGKSLKSGSYPGTEQSILSRSKHSIRSSKSEKSSSRPQSNIKSLQLFSDNRKSSRCSSSGRKSSIKHSSYSPADGQRDVQDDITTETFETYEIQSPRQQSRSFIANMSTQQRTRSIGIQPSLMHSCFSPDDGQRDVQSKIPTETFDTYKIQSSRQQSRSTITNMPSQQPTRHVSSQPSKSILKASTQPSSRLTRSSAISDQDNALSMQPSICDDKNLPLEKSQMSAQYPETDQIPVIMETPANEQSIYSQNTPGKSVSKLKQSSSHISPVSFHKEPSLVSYKSSEQPERTDFSPEMQPSLSQAGSKRLTIIPSESTFASRPSVGKSQQSFRSSKPQTSDQLETNSENMPDNLSRRSSQEWKSPQPSPSQKSQAQYTPYGEPYNEDAVDDENGEQATPGYSPRNSSCANNREREFLYKWKWWILLFLVLLLLFLHYLFCSLFGVGGCVGCRAPLPNIFFYFINSAAHSVRVIHKTPAPV